MGHPIMDLVVLTVAVRLAVSHGRRSPALSLLLTGVGAFLVTDVLSSWLRLNGGHAPGSGWLEVGWISCYALFGSAALHPLIRDVSEPQPELTASIVTPARLASLGAALLLAPLAQATQAIRHQPLDLPVVLGATISLFVLAIVRMAGFVREQQRSNLREHALREAGETLETATSREAIYTATTLASESLAGEGALVRLFVDAAAASLVGVTGSAPLWNQVDRLDALTASQRQDILDGKSLSLRHRATTPEALLRADDDQFEYLSPIFVDDQLACLISITTNSAFTETTLTGLDTLSSQVALSLERATLTEELLTRKSEARFASLVRNSSDVIVLLEKDSTIRYASPSSTVLGYAPTALEGCMFVSFAHAEDEDLVATFIAGAGRARTPVRANFAFAARTVSTSSPRPCGPISNEIPTCAASFSTSGTSGNARGSRSNCSHQAFHDP